MNTFLHRMLKKNDESEDPDEGIESFEPELKQQFLPKSKWMKKLHIPSSGKLSLSPLSPTHSSSPKARNYSEGANVQQSPTTPIDEDMQDLQRILREFETGYLSPRKTVESPIKGGKFVKRMVAALEQKYSGHKEPKTQKVEPKYKRNSLNAAGEFQIRRSYMNETFVIQPRCRSFERLSYSPEPASYFANEDRVDITDYTFEIDEGLPPKVDTPQEKYDQVFEEDEKNFTESRDRSDSILKREKAPKIVGAFLKKPIEVEETEIHWIPITNQKLPRKSSFKKLLSLLTGKKLGNKGSKLYCPQNKPNEEPKEFRDSGYDDKSSSSSSSLSSKASFNDVLLHHDTYGADLQKNTQVSTFQSLPEANNNADKFEEDIYSNQEYLLAKKLMFKEVPRSEVRLSLGPFFPAPAKVVKSLDQKMEKECKEEIYSNESREMNQSPSISPLPKHPFVSPLPKHPFVSDHSICREHQNSIMSIEEFSQIDLRRMPSWKFPSTEVIYDTPRNYLSTSSPDLVIRNKYGRGLKCYNEIIYDIPKVIVPTRPKSSLYEDALSLKRRVAEFEPSAVTRSNFYACSNEEHYATIKPRNTKVLPSQQLLMSMAENDKNQLHAPYLVNRFAQASIVF